MLRRPVPLPQRPSAAGFTLVELMITLAVISILAVIAAPAMFAMINNSRLVGQTEELVATLQTARAEAVRRNARVTVCATTDGTNCASSTSWTRWIARGRDVTTGSDDVIVDNSSNGSVVISGPSAGIVFRPSGLIDNQQQVGVSLSGEQRCLLIRVSGVVSVSKGACA